MGKSMFRRLTGCPRCRKCAKYCAWRNEEPKGKAKVKYDSFVNTFDKLFQATGILNQQRKR